MESVNIYVIKGVSIGWPYFVHSTLVRVSMESADTLCQGVIHGLATLCMSNLGQSIHEIRGYFAKGVSMGWPRYVCPTLVRISMESADTLCQGGIHGLAMLCMSNVGQSIHGIRRYFVPRGYPWVGHAMYVQLWSEYLWNPRILCQGGIHGLATLCMSNVGQSIYGIHGYFAKGVSMG